MYTVHTLGQHEKQLNGLFLVQYTPTDIGLSHSNKQNTAKRCQINLIIFRF